MLKRGGEYVCLYCHIIHVVLNEELRCTRCGRKLKWVTMDKLFELEKKWEGK